MTVTFGLSPDVTNRLVVDVLEAYNVEDVDKLAQLLSEPIESYASGLTAIRAWLSGLAKLADVRSSQRSADFLTWEEWLGRVVPLHGGGMHHVDKGGKRLVLWRNLRGTDGKLLFYQLVRADDLFRVEVTNAPDTNERETELFKRMASDLKLLVEQIEDEEVRDKATESLERVKAGGTLRQLTELGRRVEGHVEFERQSGDADGAEDSDEIDQAEADSDE